MPVSNLSISRPIEYVMLKEFPYRHRWRALTFRKQKTYTVEESTTTVLESQLAINILTQNFLKVFLFMLTENALVIFLSSRYQPSYIDGLPFE